MIHNTCNMGAHDLPDMYALSPRACGPRASGIHIRQIPCAHVTTITCINVQIQYIYDNVIYCCVLQQFSLVLAIDSHCSCTSKLQLVYCHGVPYNQI